MTVKQLINVLQEYVDECDAAHLPIWLVHHNGKIDPIDLVDIVIRKSGEASTVSIHHGFER